MTQHGTMVASDRPKIRFGRTSAELSDKDKVQKFPTKNCRTSKLFETFFLDYFLDFFSIKRDLIMYVCPENLEKLLFIRENLVHLNFQYDKVHVFTTVQFCFLN